ncbi:hypothetical protein HF851_06475 [Corynebacterium ammoniagenes]|uniref:hypothetical protein n=1 Tax=Corynebacterium ammoniagenes TaxID=1697 RepID=UPI001459D776|nr:hypothetical protein [Corynebacterium ammoniagenes]NMF31922.1 hypothetical protein [Corynebacterium ammoniagenes]
MEWFRNFSDALTQPFVAAPVWQQMGTIILVGIPALVVLAWVLMLVIDLLGKVIRRVVSSDSTVTG